MQYLHSKNACHHAFMVNAFIMSMIKTRHFAIVNLVGQVFSVTLNINVIVHQIHFASVIQSVYVHLVDSVLDAI
jgi:hypothetical protein